MKMLMRMLSPVPLAIFGGGGALLLVFWLARRFGLGLPWMILIMVGVVFLFALGIMIHKLRAVRAGTQLEKSIQEQAEQQARRAHPGREQEIDELKTRLLEAIQALKTSQVGKAKKGSQALYVLPWYMIIGPPAAGKTTLLQNSGLHYPYVDATRNRSSVRGVGGTRNCDWWFADEAVIIDTAGRYVLPVEGEDTEEWLGFLDLLRKHRSRKPINGLVVGISIQDLIGEGPETVEDHANRIRTRIDELIQRLGVTFPVYVMFTKCDLIHGFLEFFGDLSRAERAQAFGATIARDRYAREDAGEIFSAEVDRLAAVLRDVRNERLAQVAQPESRPGAFLFPLEFDAIRPKLVQFMELLFRKHPYQESPIFRGFYFTSGTQEGRPIDQVINAMLAGFGGQAAEVAHVEPSQPKSYFIEKVFDRVMFPDRNLAGPSAEDERRRRRQRVRAFTGASIGLALAAVVLFAFSAANHKLTVDVRNLSDRAQAATLGAGGRLQIEDLEVLSQLHAKLRGLEKRSGGVARLASLGTYQGDRVLEEGRRLLFAVLRASVIQPAVPDLLRRVRDEEGEGFFHIYDRYGTWRILQDPAVRLQSKADARRAAAVLGEHWALVSGSDEPRQYTEMLTPLMEYLTDYAPLRAEIFPPTRPENPLIEGEIRRRLVNNWSVAGLMPALERRTSDTPAVGLNDLVTPNMGLQSAARVPGAYTVAGWRGPVRDFLRTVEETRSEETLTSAYGRSVPPDLSDSLLMRYTDDYIGHWVDLLSSVSVQGVGSPEGTQVFLERSADVNSPILELLRGVAENTIFGEDADPRLAPIERTFGPAQELFQESGRGVFKWVKGKIDPEKAPYQEYLDLVTALRDAYAQIAVSPNPSQAKEALDLSTWIEIHLPDSTAADRQVVRLLRLPVQVVTQTVEMARGEAIQAKWSPVYRAFQEKLAGRYPCAASGPDASREDFESFFGPGGVFWSFYRENLAEVISEDGRQVFDSGVPLSDAFRAALRKAYLIRSALFRGGGQAGFTLSLRPGNPKRDPATGIISRETRLEIGGEPLIWQIGAQTWHEISWPGPNEAQGASLSFRASNATATPLRAEGVWGFFRLLNQAEIGPVSGDQGSIEWALETDVGEVRIPYEVRRLSASHPLRKDLLRFSCPADIRSGR